MSPIGATEFAAMMAGLGPFEPNPRLAVAVSGGADSLALALLADRWARAAQGTILALIVDHGLRDGSAAEAAATAGLLDTAGIDCRVLSLGDLPHGSGLAERARVARYRVLRQACADAGIVHLLLGHHLADQAETLLIRALGGSGAAGMAAMARLSETNDLRLLRPLLAVPPARLRAHLRAAGVGWIEDPSNRDERALRGRLRALRADPDGTGSATFALAAAAAEHGRRRAVRELLTANELARSVTLRPEGFAILPDRPMTADTFGALVQAVSGAAYPPDTAAVAALAAAPRPATLAGARLVTTTRGSMSGLLMLREEAAIGPPTAANSGVVWDGRFRVRMRAAQNWAGAQLVLGKLGAAAAGFRKRSDLPSAVLRTLPALWIGEKLVGVPHLGYHAHELSGAIELVSAPRRPAALASLGP